VLARLAAGTRRGRAAGALIGAAGLAALVLAALAAPALAASALPPGTLLSRLSNLHAVSHWAYPDTEATIHAAPSGGSRSVGRLRFLVAVA